ncbi:MAG: type II secretion system minor pseudopilin GspJ [Gammaproteobacteria bacterium]|nr:type II secretion system minor pseudopilin GspJ [Gammaproteobacteria bacterium]
MTQAVTKSANRSLSRLSGFTLLELLVALSIFALISVMAYSGLNSVLKSRLILEKNMDRLSQIQKTMLFMTRDISHLINRDIRDEYGDNKKSLDGSNLNAGLNGPLIELTRTGYPNPLGINRSNLQRVAYRIEDNILYRQIWLSIDRAPDSQPYRSALCDKVKSLQFRYMDASNNWHDQWPPSDTTYQESSLPKAIEFALELEDWGTITRLLPVVEV